MKFDPTQGIYLCINSEKSESFYKFGLNAARKRVQSRVGRSGFGCFVRIWICILEEVGSGSGLNIKCGFDIV